MKPTPTFGSALAQFDAHGFARRHGGYKESHSPNSHEYLLPCPHCSSDRLRWNHPSKAAWICWGCKRSGDTVDLIAACEKTDRVAAIALLEESYMGGDAPTELRSITQAPPPAAKQIPWPEHVELIDERNPAHSGARMYLARRGIDDDTARLYRIGVGRAGKLKDYVVFPVYMDGLLVYWQGRATWDPPAYYTAEMRKEWIRATAYRKTLNPYSQPGQYTAQDVVFNHDRARTSPEVVICEGPVDAIKVGPHAVALFGKSCSPSKLHRITRMHARAYVVYLDRGEEELESARHIAAQLAQWAPTRIAVPPVGSDPGSLSPAENAAVVRMAEPWEPGGLLSIRV